MKAKLLTGILFIAATCLQFQSALAQPWCPQSLCGQMNNCYYYSCLDCSNTSMMSSSCPPIFVMTSVAFDTGGACGGSGGCTGNCNESISAGYGGPFGLTQDANKRLVFPIGHNQTQLLAYDQAWNGQFKGFKAGAKSVTKTDVKMLKLTTNSGEDYFFLCLTIQDNGSDSINKNPFFIGQEADEQSFKSTSWSRSNAVLAQPTTATINGKTSFVLTIQGDTTQTQYFVTSVHPITYP